MADRDVEALVAPLHIGDKVAGDYVEIETDGTIVQHGDSTVFDDIVNSLISKRLFSSVGRLDYNFAENALVFQNNGDITDLNDVVLFNLQKPHGAKVASAAHIHIHWEQTDATNREFTFAYRLQNNGGVKTTAWTTVIVTTGGANNVFPYVSGTLNQITKLSDVDWSGVNISSTVQCKLTRSDSVAGNVLATFIDAHVEYDMNGSHQEFVK